MFDNFVKFREYIDEKGAVLVPEGFEWAKDIAKLLPNIKLDLPTVEKKAKIDVILDKKNPIFMQLSDGSKLFFTIDQFKRINGKPERGKTMTLQLLRLSTDKSTDPSQIMSCQVD